MPVTVRKGGRKSRLRGGELVEFTTVLIPLFAILFVLVDASWAIFAKSSMMYAVRTAVRRGITITGTQATAAGESLTDMVKDIVQQNANGFLNGSTNRAYIQVHYFAQDATSATGLTDVSTLSNGNAPGNLMQVSVNSYPLPALVGRIYGLFVPVDKNPSNLSAVSADMIEPSSDVPPIGSAP